MKHVSLTKISRSILTTDAKWKQIGIEVSLSEDICCYNLTNLISQERPFATNEYKQPKRIFFPQMEPTNDRVCIGWISQSKHKICLAFSLLGEDSDFDKWSTKMYINMIKSIASSLIINFGFFEKGKIFNKYKPRGK